MSDPQAAQPRVLVVEDDERGASPASAASSSGATAATTACLRGVGEPDALARLERCAPEADDPWRSCWPTSGCRSSHGRGPARAPRPLYPDAKRALLVDFGAWGDRETAEAMLRAMALGDIDYYVLKPWRRRRRVLPPHDHRVPARVGGRAAPRRAEIVVVGDASSSRTSRAAPACWRATACPTLCYDRRLAPRAALLAEADQRGHRQPVVVLRGGPAFWWTRLPSSWHGAYGVSTQLGDQPRLRRGRHRRRPGRPGRSGVRVVGGARHARRRARARSAGRRARARGSATTSASRVA